MKDQIKIEAKGEDKPKLGEGAAPSALKGNTCQTSILSMVTYFNNCPVGTGGLFTLTSEQYAVRM
jgi:hypothetical protein